MFKRNVRFVVHDDLRLHGRNCPEPSPARRSASSQGSQTAARTQARKARAALDGENAVIRCREQQDRPHPAHCTHPSLGKRSAQARIIEPGRRRQPSEARERWKPEWGETRAARLDAQHDSATAARRDAMSLCVLLTCTMIQ
ncbi:hypothetical protein EV018_07100 [Citrobacter freundii]|nr:hypothetical protein EV018_07100 [Citrobacter freundii]